MNPPRIPLFWVQLTPYSYSYPNPTTQKPMIEPYPATVGASVRAWAIPRADDYVETRNTGGGGGAQGTDPQRTGQRGASYNKGATHTRGATHTGDTQTLLTHVYAVQTTSNSPQPSTHHVFVPCQSTNQKSSQSHTRARRSRSQHVSFHIPIKKASASAPISCFLFKSSRWARFPFRHLLRYRQ